MAKVKKWVWKIVETDEYVEVPLVSPPIGEPSKKYSLPLVTVDPAKPGDDRTVMSKTTIENGEITKVDVLGLGPPPVVGAWSDAWTKQLPKTVKPREGEKAEFGVLDHPDIGGKFTICVLGYGDNLPLVERCIGSILDTCPPHRFDLRVALNQPSPRLLDYVLPMWPNVVSKVYLDTKDRKKYPAMREMFWDKEHPITTQYVCWFDDDSWCRKKDWMVLLARTITHNHPHGGRLYGAWMFHDLMSVKRKGALREQWFIAAPWWRGKQLFSGNGRRPAPNGSQIVFASGGFWALATEVIKAQDIPDKRLNHNGGDATIGCQVTQGGYKVVDFSPRPDKAIIAWSDAARRGYREDFPWA